MNTKTLNTLSASLLCVGLAACETDFDNPVSPGTADAGDADFTTFIAVGDSLTAGFADSALYTSGQENSYPNMLAGQFALAGGGTFTQPLMADNLGGLFAGMTPLAANRLVFDAVTSAPEPIAGTGTTDAADLSLNGMAFNNYGVPGAKSYHLGAPGYGQIAGIGTTANPYYARFSTDPSLGPLDPGAPTLLGDAAAQAPTFFVLWIGNNDILSFATDGGANGVDQLGNTDPLTYGQDDITDPTAFAGVYTAAVAALTAVPGNKGVLVNLPDVNAIPFFTTVPFNAVPLDATTAAGLNMDPNVIGYNLGLDAAVPALLTQEQADARKVNYVEGLNPIIIEDESLIVVPGLPNPPVRPATADDLIVLSASSKIGTEATPGDPATTWGVSLLQPLVDADVLLPSEQALVEAARTAFNATIAAAAAGDPDLVLYDAAADLDTLAASGISYGGGAITDDYVTGGGFSLDGVHPTARGYAVITNGIIDTINAGFNASIPPVDPGSKTTVFFK